MVWFKRILLGLAVGIIATIAVAWRIAVVTEYADGVPTVFSEIIVRDGEFGFLRVIEQSRGPGCRIRIAFPITGFDDMSRSGAGVVPTGERPSWLTSELEDSRAERHVGWPFLAFRSEARVSGARPHRMTRLVVGAAPTTYTLPIVPRWGFFADVAFYAALYVLGATAVARLLARFRRRPRFARAARLMLHALVAVTLGTVLTFGAAWYAAVRYASPALGRGTVLPLPVSYLDTASQRAFAASEFRGVGWRQLRLTDMGDANAAGQLTGLVDPPARAPVGLLRTSPWSTIEFGWPILALRFGHAYPDPDSGIARALPSIWFHKRFPSTYTLPITPIWPGFIASAALYGVPYLALGACVAWLRRRRRRGGCTSCGYNRRGLPPDAPCPECGTAHAPPG